MINLWVDYFNY